MVTQRKCSECDYRFEVDTGYSDYTVEGTDFFCLLEKHPNDGFDMWYKVEEKLNFAVNCDSFFAGPGVRKFVEETQEELLYHNRDAEGLLERWLEKHEHEFSPGSW